MMVQVAPLRAQVRVFFGMQMHCLSLARTWVIKYLKQCPSVCKWRCWLVADIRCPV